MRLIFCDQNLSSFAFSLWSYSHLAKHTSWSETTHQSQKVDLIAANHAHVCAAHIPPLTFYYTTATFPQQNFASMRKLVSMMAEGSCSFSAISTAANVLRLIGSAKTLGNTDRRERSLIFHRFSVFIINCVDCAVTSCFWSN